MFFKSIFKVGVITLISRILGLIRDTTTAVFLGTSAYSDAFVIAFKLPNVFRRLFAEGSLNSVFIPIFTGLVNSSGEQEARRFSNEIFTILVISLFVLIALMEIFMPYVLLAVAPGFNLKHKEEYELAITLTRLTLPYLFFISLASVYASILNSFKRFGVVAALPLVLNITIILFFWLSKVWRAGLDSAYFGSAGITAAGIFQCFLMFLCVYRLNWKLVFVSLRTVSQSTKNFFKRVLPVIITAGIYQINVFIDLTIASWLGGGAITYLYYGDRLNQLPLAIIGIATSTVIVPFIVSSNSKKEECFGIKCNALLYGILLGLPAVLAFLILGKEIIIMLFNYGKFDETSVKYTYYVLCFYALGLIPNILIKIIVAIFYAESDGKTPFYVNLSILIINTILAIVLAKYIGVVGIALATTVSSCLSVIILGTVLYKKGLIKFDKSFLRDLIWGALITVIIFLAVFLVKDWILLELKMHFGRLWFSVALLLLIAAVIAIWLYSLKLVKSRLYYEIVSLVKRKST